MSIKVSLKFSRLAWLAATSCACYATLAANAQAPSPLTGYAPPPRLSFPAVSAPDTAVNLVQALQAARDNLDVSLARSALGAARADILAADRAPLPVLSAKAGQMDFQNGLGSGNPLTQKRIDKAVGLDWTWERGNKRELRTRAAQRSAAAALADVDDTRSQQLLGAWAAYFDLLAAQDRLSEVQAIAQSAAQLATTANRRVSAGDLSVQDATRTEIESQRALSDVTLAQVDRQRAIVALAAWMFHPSQVTSTPGLLAQADWPALDAVSPIADNTLQALVDQRGDVRAAQERVQAAQALVDGANALKQSDVTVGSSIDHFPGTSTRLLELRMQMPLQWNYSYGGEIARAQALQIQTQEALEKVRLLATGEMQRLQQELMGAAQRARAYEADILPRARKVAEGAELAYNKGAIPLTDLLDARRTLRATLLDALSARTDHAKALGAWQLRTDPQSLPGRLALQTP